MNVVRFPVEATTRQSAIFLGGSTAKGNWQPEIEALMADTGATLVNTSRPDWDRKILSPADIEEHSGWEMRWLKVAEFAFIFIDESAKSPTVLLELGLALANVKQPKVVFVDKGYSHYTNVLAACTANHVPVESTWDEALKRLKDMYLKLHRF